jgi:hypothetical protein
MLTPTIAKSLASCIERRPFAHERSRDRGTLACLPAGCRTYVRERQSWNPVGRPLVCLVCD